MANYLNKYKGKYRLKANIDMTTNDFPRDMNDKIEDYDVYIKCRKGQIYHYGRSTLVCYCNSLGSGRNILKAIAEEIGINYREYTSEIQNKNGETLKSYDYDTLYKLLEENGIVFNIEETDSELLWRFKDKDIELMTKYMQAQTSGSNISPFSTKNLPKQKYEISADDLNVYREITNSIPKDDLLTLSHLTKRFISEIMTKSKQYKNINIKQTMKKKMLKGKEFIHSEGFWNEYLKFLKENI